MLIAKLFFPLITMLLAFVVKKLGHFIYEAFILKPRLHERFFACGGDAIFLKLSRRQRVAKIACVATL